MAEVTPEPLVWIVNSQHWPRAYLRAELIERGFDAVGFVELTQALAALYRPSYARPRVIVLELRNLSLRRDQLNILARVGIPTILLGGAVELNETLLTEFEWAAMIRRPFTMGEVADAVEELIGRSTAE